MKLSVAAVVLAMSVAGRPQDGRLARKDLAVTTLSTINTISTMTVAGAKEACGHQLDVRCCEDESIRSSNVNSNGILSGVLNGVLANDGVTLIGQCAPVDVTVIGVNNLLRNVCKGKVACCDKRPNIFQGGLVNVLLNCIVIGDLLA